MILQKYEEKHIRQNYFASYRKSDIKKSDRARPRQEGLQVGVSALSLFGSETCRHCRNHRCLDRWGRGGGG